MSDVLHQWIQLLWRYRWWLAVILCIPFIGMAVFCWWISPEYRPEMVTFWDVAIDGVSVETEMPNLEAGREYISSCKANANGLPFAIVDSGEQPYADRLPFLPDPGPERPHDRFDPVFNVAFSTRWRTGRPMGFMYGSRVKPTRPERLQHCQVFSRHRRPLGSMNLELFGERIPMVGSRKDRTSGYSDGHECIQYSGKDL